jgi:hypothetical protein
MNIGAGCVAQSTLSNGVQNWLGVVKYCPAQAETLPKL